MMERTQTMKISKPFSPAFREGAVRLAMEHRDGDQSEAAALTAIAGKLGCSPDSRSVLGRHGQCDGANGQASAEKARSGPLVQAHWRASWSTRTGNCAWPMRSCTKRPRILPMRERRCGSASALPEAARPPASQMMIFIEENRSSFGAEPICGTWQIAPSIPTGA